jgi:hypothetical protein
VNFREFLSLSVPVFPLNNIQIMRAPYPDFVRIMVICIVKSLVQGRALVDPQLVCIPVSEKRMGTKPVGSEGRDQFGEGVLD